MSELDTWDSFYVIVGSSAGALIGLQFVVMTLIAERPVGSPTTGAAFGTPTVVHFGTALLVSALQRVPWPSMTLADIVWGVVGLSGATYTAIVGRRIHRQDDYDPVLEDWLFHFALPMVAYVLLGLSPFGALASTREAALFAVGASTLLLLFIGIHNAWDSVAFLVYMRRRTDDGSRGAEGSEKEGR